MIRKSAIFILFASLAFGAEHDYNIKQQRANGTLADRVVSPPASGFQGYVAHIPQAMTLLPVITQQGITQTGTLLGGGTGAGFTIDFAASTLSGIASLTSALALDNVTNHAQTQAAIVPNTLPTPGQILIGNAGGTAYVPLSISGHATLSSSGVLTLATSGAVAGTYTNATVTVDVYGRVTSVATGSASGTGDVVGPASSTIGNIPTFADATGKLLGTGLEPSAGGNGSADTSKIPYFGASGQLFADHFWAKNSAGTLVGYFSPTGFQIEEPGGGFSVTVQTANLTANRGIFFPDQAGTLAVTTDIPDSPIKAGVEFNQTVTTGSPTGTYSRTSPSGVTTITETAHGRVTGHWIYADFTSGGAASASDGNYTITVVDANNYTITTAATTTASGNVTMLQFPITATTAFNVHSICASATAGFSIINFSVNTFTDALYRGHVECFTASTSIGIGYVGWTIARTTVAAGLQTVLPTTAAGTAFSSVRVTLVR
jgi:hypothetical protein